MDLNLIVPDSWNKLSQRQLKTVYSYLASGSLSIHQCKILLAFKFAGVKFYGMHAGEALISVAGIFYYLDENELLAIAHSLDFIESVPEFPVRLFEIKHRKAVHPLMRDLTFEQWLAIENFFFGYLESNDVALLNEVLSILYPARGFFPMFRKPFKSKVVTFAHVNVIKWLSAFKLYLSRRFPEIYRASSVDDNMPMMAKPSLIESMNAQIRALTKGDITKKEAILKADLHTALTELDALALEARKLNEAIKKKS